MFDADDDGDAFGTNEALASEPASFCEADGGAALVAVMSEWSDSGACYFHGFVVLRWHLATSLEKAADLQPHCDRLRGFVDASSPTPTGLLVYVNEQTYGLVAGGSMVAACPSLRLPAQSFGPWLRSVSGGWLCKGADNVTVTVADLVDQALRAGGDLHRRVYQWHVKTREDAVAFMGGACHAQGYAANNVCSVAGAHSAHRPSVSHANTCFYQPPKRTLEAFRKICVGLRNSVLPSVCHESGPPCLEHAELQLVARHNIITRGWQRRRYETWFHIDCVLFSGNMRNVAKLKQQSRDGLGVVFGDAGLRFYDAQIKYGFPYPVPSLVRFNRVRLDLACAQYERQFPLFRRVRDGVTTSELLFDASRGFGREVMSIVENTLYCSIDAPKPLIISRRLVAVSLAHKHMSAEDKGIAVLHAAFVKHGPSKQDIDTWARSVRVTPIDFGVEASLTDCQNIIPAFFGTQPCPSDSPYFLPLALRIGGWNHQWHALVQDTIKRCFPWFPEWLPVFKHVCDFLSDKSYMDVLRAELIAASRGDLLDDSGAAPPVFIESRWGTVVRGSAAVYRYKEALRQGFVSEQYRMTSKMAQDIVLAIRGNEAVRFWERTYAIATTLGEAERARVWGNGCECHEEDRLAGKVVSCGYGGRRLGHAYSRVESARGVWNAAIGAVSELENVTCLVLKGQCISGYVGQIGTSSIKFGYLSKLPYTILQFRAEPHLITPSVVKYDSIIASSMRPHRVSSHFLDSQSPFREQLIQYADTGVISDALSLELMPYEWGLLSEQSGEAPHRDFALEKQRAHAAKHPYGVATVSLNQNRVIVDWARSNVAQRHAFEECWKSWKAVAAPPQIGPAPRLYRVPKEIRRMSAKTVIERVYRLGDISRVDWTGLSRLFGTQPIKVRPYSSEMDALVGNYLFTVLKDGGVYSIPEGDPDDWELDIVVESTALLSHVFPSGDDLEARRQRRRYFEVVSARPRKKKQQIVTDEDRLNAQAPTNMVIQRWCQWTADNSGRQKSAELFLGESPRLEVVAAFAPYAALRFGLREWGNPSMSDARGCVNFLSDGFVDFSAIDDARSLPLCVQLERLAFAGWVASRPPTQPHELNDDRRLCLESGFMKRPLYYTCLLVFPSLCAKGLISLACDQADIYYEAHLELCDVSHIPCNLRHAQYQQMIRADIAGERLAIEDLAPAAQRRRIDDDEIGIASLAPPFLAIVGVESGLLPICDGAAVVDDDDDDAIGILTLDRPSGSGSASSRVVVARGRSSGILAVDYTVVEDLYLAATAADLPTVVDGQPVSIDHCQRPTRGPAYVRKKVRCNHVGHINCFRNRNCNLSLRHGQLEPLAHLTVWLRAAANYADRASHMRMIVSEAAEDACVAELRNV
jgi:hypothetical protein